MTEPRESWADFARWAWLSGEPCHLLLKDTPDEADRDVLVYEYGRCETAEHVGWKHKNANSTNKASG